MNLYDVQITTDLNEVVVLQVYATSDYEAELTAISMVEHGQAYVEGSNVIDCFVI